MISCPNCGTSNMKGSRFCNECGEPLPRTGIRCPMCGATNPVGNVYCEDCNARLEPLTSPPDEDKEQSKPIEGFSLPTIPLSESRDEQSERKRAGEGTRNQKGSSDNWLDELRESTDGPSSETEGTEKKEGTADREDELAPAEIPDWLSDLGPVSEEATRETDVERDQEAIHEEGKPEESVPMIGDTEKEPEAPSAAEGEGALEFEEEAPPEPAKIPDWLRDLQPDIEETPFAAETDTPTEKLTEAEVDPDQLGAEEPELEEIPSWLQDILASEAGASQQSEPGATVVEEPETTEEEPAAIEIPDWLSEAQASASVQPPGELVEEEPIGDGEPAKREPETGPPAESFEIPGWLQEVEGATDEAPFEEGGLPFAKKASEDVETPDWLSEVMAGPPEEMEGAPLPGGPALEEVGGDETDVPAGDTWDPDLERADIPNWLQELRPSRGPEADVARGPVETEGLLKGLRGLIPAVPATGTSTRVEGQAPSEPSEASLARAELLQSLLAEPAVREARPEAESKVEGPPLTERWLVAAILIIAVVGVLLAPVVTGERVHLTQPLKGSAPTQLYGLIGDLTPGDEVLIAFDYGPAEADELNAVAGSVLAHIIDRGAAISIVSTRPDGLLVAGTLMERIVESEDQYTLIGYRPGAGTAVSQLLTATQRPPSLLLVLTARPMPLRLWVEQATARYGNDLPIAAAGSAALEPIAGPYLAPGAGQLRGAVFGLRGGAGYESERGIIADATGRLDALAAGHITIILLMIVGALVHAFDSLKGERA